MRKLNSFGNRKKYIHFIRVVHLLLWVHFESNFGQYFNCVKQGNLIDFEIEETNQGSLILKIPPNKNIGHRVYFFLGGVESGSRDLCQAEFPMKYGV